MGGMFMLFTFPERVDRDSLGANKDIKNWFVSLRPWNGESSSLSRFVWINCRGMPLSAWMLMANSQKVSTLLLFHLFLRSIAL
ncbi:hypothetical protein RHGRI_007053 [Rhododendron griersonianum]|uniref:Uncharacterized protein n=1 Tax=Rhododendron griersonianum TaxID=479676 RepID=A0AAV6KWZ9_9ERIC|nr:hypothetical protein RHGRI_007053 [Rhododendron griersonianum]